MILEGGKSKPQSVFDCVKTRLTHFAAKRTLEIIPETEMKYMVQFRFQADNKQAVLEKFERLGPNRHAGVVFRSAWIGVDANLAFVLVESDSEDQVTAAAETWKAQGEFSIHPVIDIERY